MIVRAMKCVQAANIGRVVVACAEEQIAEVVRSHGGEAVLTPADLPTGTDRIAHALEQIDPEGKIPFALNIQGDQPIMNPADLKQLADLTVSSEYDLATLCSPIRTSLEVLSPNIVKILFSPNNPDIQKASGGRVLYFSRTPVTCGPNFSIFHHIGVYGFKRQALRKFVATPPSPLELHERCEPLRALELGMTIGVRVVGEAPQAVDCPEDRDRVLQLLKAK